MVDGSLRIMMTMGNIAAKPMWCKWCREEKNYDVQACQWGRWRIEEERKRKKKKKKKMQREKVT